MPLNTVILWTPINVMNCSSLLTLLRGVQPRIFCVRAFCSNWSGTT